MEKLIEDIEEFQKLYNEKKTKLDYHQAEYFIPELISGFQFEKAKAAYDLLLKNTSSEDLKTKAKRS